MCSSTVALSVRAARARPASGLGYDRSSAGSAMAQATGPKLTKYDILEPLSTGGMGDVYLAEDTTLRRKVAVKVLSQEWAQDPERFQRFQREARVLATLNHPNIVTIYSVEEDEGVHFLTMELVEGETLAKIIPSVGLNLDRIFEIAVPLADALAAAHEQGIIHRDLKPGNIMVSRQGRLKILDFGLAKRQGVVPGEAQAAEPITQEGLMLGTVPYMSPEQLQGDEVDQRSDLFSLGVILFEMCTGRRPFEGRTWSDLASSILRDQPASVTTLNIYLPRHLGRIIRHCLEKDPKRRFQTALDLRNELEELRREVQSGELPVTRSDLSSIIIPRPRRETEKIVAVIASVLVVAVVLGLLWMRSGNRPPAEDVVASSSGATAPAALPPVAAETGPSTVGGAGTTAQTSPSPIGGTAAPLAAAAQVQPRRIVVLPMENLGPADHQYFAAGITEEITSRLSAVRALHVISGTTARNYQLSEKTVQQIGQELGVDYLLTGSVRWNTGSGESNRVRVTPQLIQVADDAHLWSQSYDRVLNDIFAVQSEIAEEVLRQLDIALIEPEQQVLASRPTQHLDAYQAYLRGMDYVNHRNPAEENLLQAADLLQRATELDPEFALAYAELSEVHSHLYHGYDRTDERLRFAREAADRVKQLAPDLPAAHRALGYYYYWGHGDYETALQEFAIASQALPNDSQLLEGIAYIRRRQGRFDDAVSEFRRAFELDPESGRLAMELAHTYTISRQYEQADQSYKRSISLSPNEPIPYQLKALNDLLWKGAVDEARATLEVMPRQELLSSLTAWFRLELLEGDFEAALARIQEAPQNVLLSSDAAVFPRSFLRARAYRVMGRPKEARQAYDQARLVMERIAQREPEDPRVRSVLGMTYAGLGRKEEAIREGLLAVRLTPCEEDAIRGWALKEQLAAIYATVGEANLALDVLDSLLAMPAEISVPLMRLDPMWQPLHDHPRFVALVESDQI